MLNKLIQVCICCAGKSRWWDRLRRSDANEDANRQVDDEGRQKINYEEVNGTNNEQNRQTKRRIDAENTARREQGSTTLIVGWTPTRTQKEECLNDASNTCK